MGKPQPVKQGAPDSSPIEDPIQPNTIPAAQDESAEPSIDQPDHQQVVLPSSQRSSITPVFRDHQHDANQASASPAPRPPVRSLARSPVPSPTPSSPLLATKFNKASEHASPKTQFPLRRAYNAISKENQENALAGMGDQHEKQTLYRPKSKLRLRLKLTPPHPAGVKVGEATPTKPSLKVKLLSSSTRVNQQPVRQPSHQQQTSISTIRAHTPTLFYSPNAALRSPSASSIASYQSRALPPIQTEPTISTPQPADDTYSNRKTTNDYFPTRFESASPSSDLERTERSDVVKQREEREKRTTGWFPPIKAIPRSRSAWNLRVDDGKVNRGGEDGAARNMEGRFESDFDGRDLRKGGMSLQGEEAETEREVQIKGASTAASSTLVPEAHSNPHMKANSATSEVSVSSLVPHDAGYEYSAGQGDPRPYDALAVITADHPNNSSSTVNLTLTISDHSSIRSPTPGESASTSVASRKPEALASHGAYSTHKELSPSSVASSSPFTLDKSTRSRINSPGDWIDTSVSSALNSGEDSFMGQGVLTPQKSNPHGRTPHALARTPSPNPTSTPIKSGMLSPYTHGLNPIAMYAVNAWSPSKAFAYTDAENRHAGEVLDCETDRDTLEDGQEFLNESYGTETSADTSAIAEQAEWSSRFNEGKLQQLKSTSIHGEAGGNSAQSDGEDQSREETSKMEVDTSIDSAYTASVHGAQYMTPPKAHRKKNPDVRRKEREAGGEVANDVFSLTDQMLSDRYKFVQEIGFGNWGSVWQCKPRTPAAHPLHRSTVSRTQPSLSHAIASQHHPTKVAIKLVHRSKQATTAARVRALWSEMKIVRTLKADPHPNIIGFDSFIITPSYALIIMPFLAQLMPVSISEERAKGYFMQLTSALAYLHENGVTHNDIKPSNIMLSSTNTPIFVDFGFAQKWDIHAVDTGGNTLIGGLTTLTGHNASCHELFHSEISWGTPEYLDPQRAKGLRHDERASDVWALGVTFFEILVGRTPFEESEDEHFSTTEQLNVYYDRTVQGKWLGDWSMSSAMKTLLQSMIQPDPMERITASGAHHHRALATEVQMDMSTPPFVRTAASLPIELKGKKQVPREKRDQKRSQALQEETGAKFIQTDKATRILSEKPIEGPVKILPAKETAIQPLTSPTTGTVRETQRNDSCIPRSERTLLDAIKSDVSPALQRQHDPETTDIEAREVQSMVPTKYSRHDLTRDLRRPASAAALRSDVHAALHHEQSERADKAQQVRAFGRQMSENGRGDSQYFRHTRIASESGVRHLDKQLQAEKEQGTAAMSGPGRVRPKSQLSFERVRMVENTEHSNRPPDRMVHFDGKDVQTAAAEISQTSQIKSELADLRNAATSADLDAKLDRIALWVEDVEHIVEEAKHALQAVQAERPPSRQLLHQLVLDQENQDGYRKFVPVLRPASAAGTRIQEMRRPSSSLHLRYESNYELSPVIQNGDFKPTHLRRQRSDLTNFRSRADPSLEELRRQDYEKRGYDEWPETHTKAEFAKKLKTYRSTGDLHRLADLRKKEHQMVLDEIERNNRTSEGWYRYEGKEVYLVQEQIKGPQESRLKSMFHSVKSIFKRRGD